ncbi:hypothetical protein PIB30_114183, partial [Stylosanthes scabra]|nr:hypothetical protein [Stylosanthes scabra]
MEDQRRGCSHPWKKLYWHFSLKQTDEECKRLWECVENPDADFQQPYNLGKYTESYQ